MMMGFKLRRLDELLPVLSGGNRLPKNLCNLSTRSPHPDDIMSRRGVVRDERVDP